VEFSSTRGKLMLHLLGFSPADKPAPNRSELAGMPNTADTTARQNCLFRAARTAMSNDRDRRHIGGYLRCA
jgi:hypothetical protein